MEIKELSRQERYDVYHHRMIYDFHPTELKSYDRIEWLLEQGYYKCYGLFETETATLMGYSYIVKGQLKENTVILLDYYAICPEFRARGVGSRYLQLIREQLLEGTVGLLAEVENPDYGGDEEDCQLRRKRLSFYQKNGFLNSKVLSRVLVDEYQIIQLPFTSVLNDKEVEDALKSIYKQVFSEEFYEKEIFVRLKNRETD